MQKTLITFLTLLGIASSAIAEDSQPPNVLLILSDDQCWTDYSFMGHPQIKTPHIDKLAKESLTFPHGYVPASLCCPSLATIITGRYPFQHGITGNEPPNSEGRYTPGTEFANQVNELTAKMQNQSTLVRSLVGKKGYLAHQSGKWWMGNHKVGGFTHGMTHGDMTRGGRHGDDGLEIGRKGLKPVFDFIEEAGDKPFCLWYAPFLPHSPHTPPQRLLDKYKDQVDSIHIAKYYAMCEWFDETCGQLLDHLDAKGKGDNTIVIYVCDNGWIQNANNANYADKSKRSQYDGGLRTPIMVRWRGHVTPAMIDTPVSSIDIAPTVLAACGLPDEAKNCNLPGINLMDLDAVRARKTIYGDIHLHNAVDINDPAKNVTYRWALRDGLKLIIPNKENVTTRAGSGSKGNGEIELYNVLNDPTEEKNLAAEDPEKVKELTEAINAWWPAVPKP